MAGKKLHELTMSELNLELERASIFGSFSESEAVVRLTIFLVRMKKDPFTFQFEHTDLIVKVDMPREDVTSPETSSVEMFIPNILAVTDDVPRESKENMEISVDNTEDVSDIVDEPIEPKEDVTSPEPEPASVEMFIPNVLVFTDDVTREAKENRQFSVDGTEDMLDIGEQTANEVTDVKALFNASEEMLLEVHRVKDEVSVQGYVDVEFVDVLQEPVPGILSTFHILRASPPFTSDVSRVSPSSMSVAETKDMERLCIWPPDEWLDDL